MSRFSLLRLLAAVTVLVGLTACGGSPETGEPDPATDQKLEPSGEPDTTETGSASTPGSGASSSATASSDTLEPWEVEDPSTLPETDYYAIVTSEGRMVVRLYEDTPIHRQNFKKLARDGFYDGTSFHRIIDGFMIQGGDPNTKDESISNDGNGDPGYTLPAEIRDDRYHRRGALAAARQPDSRNPDRRSNGSQFYVVDGSTYSKATLAKIVAKVREATGNENFSLEDEAVQIYRTEGGAPSLDKQYTVFGELVEGFDVLDAIAGSPTYRTTDREPPSRSLVDHPIDPISVTVEPLPDYDAQASAE